MRSADAGVEFGQLGIDLRQIPVGPPIPRFAGRGSERAACSTTERWPTSLCAMRRSLAKSAVWAGGADFIDDTRRAPGYRRSEPALKLRRDFPWRCSAEYRGDRAREFGEVGARRRSGRAERPAAGRGTPAMGGAQAFPAVIGLSDKAVHAGGRAFLDDLAGGVSGGGG